MACTWRASPLCLSRLHAANLTVRQRTRSCVRVVCVAYSNRAGSVVDQQSKSIGAPVAKLYYDGIVLDMDGTLTRSNIDFEDMRNRTGIPTGDLFTVMESWKDPKRIEKAMDVILDLEAAACENLQPMTGLLDLFKLLSSRKVRVALVTRNTTASVDAFFRLAGQQWRSLFSVVLTRSFQFVKPDKRLLLHVAEEWGVEPSRMLMVGDSFEDVECGNAAGTATCLIAGGGNEKPGSAAAPPPGAVPTFSVQDLRQLAAALRGAADANISLTASPGSSQQPQLMMGWPARRAAGENVVGAGAPPPGLEFLDFLLNMGAVRPCSCSFPRMGAAAGGLATSQLLGDKVLHLGCCSGALTKLIASQGMAVVGVDTDVAAATKRGLQAEPFASSPLTTGSLRYATARGPFNSIIFYGKSEGELERRWHTAEALTELTPLLAPGGTLCVEAPWPADESVPAQLEATLEGLDMSLIALLRLGGVGVPDRLRLVARRLNRQQAAQQ